MTILVDRRQMRGDLDQYIQRLEGLLSHLKALKAGQLPSAAELKAAPLLDLYRPSTRPAECLVGFAEGHPTIVGGITTSDLWSYAPTLGWARTLSRLYRLGRPVGASDRQWN
jgi:hypothetical protein